MFTYIAGVGLKIVRYSLLVNYKINKAGRGRLFMRVDT